MYSAENFRRIARKGQRRRSQRFSRAFRKNDVVGQNKSGRAFCGDAAEVAVDHASRPVGGVVDRGSARAAGHARPAPACPSRAKSSKCRHVSS